jgi:hypothetical protein
VTVQSVRLISKASTISVAVPISDTVGVSVTAAIRVGVAIPIAVSISVPAPSATARVASASAASPAAAGASAAVTRAGAGAIAATAGARTIITALGARHGDDEPAESILNGISEVGSKRENDNRNENEHHGILNGGHPALPDSCDTMLECVNGFHALCSCSHCDRLLATSRNVLSRGPVGRSCGLYGQSVGERHESVNSFREFGTMAPLIYCLRNIKLAMTLESLRHPPTTN